MPTPGARHRGILDQLLTDGDVRGNLVTDAHLAALAIEYGTSVCSFDGAAEAAGDRPWGE